MTIFQCDYGVCSRAAIALAFAMVGDGVATNNGVCHWNFFARHWHPPKKITGSRKKSLQHTEHKSRPQSLPYVGKACGRSKSEVFINLMNINVACKIILIQYILLHCGHLLGIFHLRYKVLLLTSSKRSILEVCWGTRILMP